ncbi:protein MpSPL3 [Marchantia polymorpha subsp. ruderalis]
MDSEGGSQVALDTYTRSSPPFLPHQFFPGARVRETVNGGRQGSLDHGAYNHQYNGARMADWDVKSWDWDHVLFLAQPNPQAAQPIELQRTYQTDDNGSRRKFHAPSRDGVVLRLDGTSTSPDHNGSSDHDDPYVSDRRRKHHLGYQDNGYGNSDKAQPFLRDGSSPEEDAESLSLKLGGHSYAYSDDAGNGPRGTKRFRSSSPGPQFPMCQVDDCKADLSHAKDYHRRHKVCEMHAKAGKASVTRLMQRFCQQCSRFHPLTAFDEGKRSCRRRLAGHNSRRRKNQPDPTAARGYGNGEENGAGNVAGLVGILNILTQLQAVSSVGAIQGAVSEREALVRQYLKKGITPAGLEGASLANLFKVNGVSAENGRPDLKPQSSTNDATHNGSAEPADAWFSALASAAAAPATTETLSFLLQSQLASALLKAAEVPHASVSTGNGSLPLASLGARMPEKDVEHAVACPPLLSLSSPMVTRPLETHLASSSRSRSNSILQQGILENSVHRGEHQQTDLQSGKVSPSAVPQKLFPVTQASEYRGSGNGKLDVNRDDDGATESTSDGEAPASMMTFMEGQESRNLQEVVSHPSRPCIDLQLPPPQNLSESSPSGSDNSPSSSSHDWQGRTGRITFKLFDKDPGELPQSLRKEILEWLAHRPSDMESHIRPGCVVLTIFLSMPSLAWGELESNMRASLQRLTSCGTFWCNGRIHVQVERQNALIVDGRVHINKPKGSRLPQILSVRPLAVVAGQSTKIFIRGSNLKRPGTGIFCPYQGKYMAEGVQWADGQQARETVPPGRAESEEAGTGEDALEFTFSGGLPGIVSRCFIEVERQAGGGDAVPVIVADNPVCSEIRSLEQEIENQGLIAANQAKLSGCEPEEVFHQIRVARAMAELEVKNVLNELGWLFLNSQTIHPLVDLPLLVPSRQKRLLVYAVERDWCAVVKQILDIIFALGLSLETGGQTLNGLVEIFDDETSLLHRAVKKKCRPMVELLLAYVPYSGVDDGDVRVQQVLSRLSRHGSQYRCIFTPDVAGPEGFTPLHVAASMEGAEGIIDALTSDPNYIGLHTWSHVQNSMGETPFACALAGKKASYMQLVRSKLARRDGQVTINMPINMPISVSSIFGHPSTSAANNPQYSLELPVWSNRAFPQVEMPVAARLVHPRRCSHVPASMRHRASRASLYRPFMVSMVAVAALCVCVCVVMRGPVTIRFILPPFSWNSVKFGFQ